MNTKKLIYSGVCVLLYLALVDCQASRQPEVYYANLGQSVTLQCKVGGGQYACFSTYTFQNSPFEMVVLNNSLKYTVSSGSIALSNVKATDAGFYACSSDCRQMKIDQVSYYLQPISNGQQVDTSKSFVAIPRFPSKMPTDEIMYVVVTNESDQNVRGGVLSAGEIAGLVIGLVFAFLLTITIVVLLIFLAKRRKQKREKILELGQKSVDYSTVEEDGQQQQQGDNVENKKLAQNKYDQDGNLIQTKNVRGPNAYRPSDLNMNPRDLPNVDINSHLSSQGRGSNQGSYLGNNNQPRNHSSQSGSYIGQQQSRNPSYQGSYSQNPNHPSRQYSNQMDVPYENQSQQQVPRPNRRISETSQNQNNVDGMLPPPPKNGPVNNNKINFPSRSNSSQQPFVSAENLPLGREPGYNSPLGEKQASQRQQPLVQDRDENPHLRQIVKESGFNMEPIRNNPVLPQYVSDDENINLQQIIKESGFLADEILSPYKNELVDEPRQPRPKQKQPEYEQEPTRQPSREPRRESQSRNAEGGVTVVSARTPSTGNGSTQGFSVLPPTANRSNNSLQQQPQMPPRLPADQQKNQKPQLPHLSYSQRIETTSTPMQSQPASRSLRAQNTAGMSRPAKEGATDV